MRYNIIQPYRDLPTSTNQNICGNDTLHLMWLGWKVIMVSFNPELKKLHASYLHFWIFGKIIAQNDYALIFKIVSNILFQGQQINVSLNIWKDILRIEKNCL